ncbi:MAG: hypothetical protein V2A58_05760 [Planctomycetota bacterium]
MDVKTLLIRHGEKFGLAVLALFLLWRLLAGGVPVPELPDLDAMINQVRQKIETTAKEDPPPGIFTPYKEMVERDWLSDVQQAWEHPLGKPALDWKFSEDSWITEPRPKGIKPDELRFLAPLGLTADGLPGAVMLRWAGPKDWSMKGESEMAALGVGGEGARAAAGAPRAGAQEAQKLYQVTSAGVVKIQGFNLYRSLADSDDFQKVNGELLDPVALVPKSAMPTERGGMTGLPPGLGVGMERPGAPPVGEYAVPSRAPRMDEAYMPTETVGAPRPGESSVRALAVAFEYLDRGVYPEYKYVYRLEAVGEVLQVVQPKNPEDFSAEEFANRPKVGDVLKKETAALEQAVEVKSDVLIACMGGTPDEGSIIVYKWTVNERGDIEEATDQFSVRAGQEIGYRKTVSVKVPKLYDMRGGPEERMMPGYLTGPGSPGDMRRPGEEDMYDPRRTAAGGAAPTARRSLEDRGGAPRDVRAPGEGRGMRGGAASPGGDSRRTTRSPSRGAARPDAELGAGQFDTVTKEMDFSTGMILLDIVPLATEIEVPTRKGETTTVMRSFARRAYKIVVVDRLQRLKEYYKMTRDEAEAMRRDFARAFGMVSDYTFGGEPGMEGGPMGYEGPGMPGLPPGEPIRPR